MKKLSILLPLFLMSFTSNDPITGWTYAELEKADTGWSASYLSLEERNTIKLMNIARMDGRRFFDTYIKDYVIKLNTNWYSVDTTGYYYTSLKEDLYKTKNLPLLYPDRLLFEAAKYHAVDMGKSGQLGHESNDGTSFYNRLKRITGTEYSVSENCAYGSSKAMDIVFQLLHDEGVESLGHRHNILNQSSKSVGVAIRSHKVYRYNCVMDFSNEPAKQK
ncbi:allergen V5/TPX-1 family protein [Flammeovirgaceae bacterium 311]|nr:allergen V5/TPX-1 family protein [Flammeovirgaceae bacterium 311]